ncbi:MAG TPA: hypothetical protein VGE21_00495 [Flavobacteriales bacterium]
MFTLRCSSILIHQGIPLLLGDGPAAPALSLHELPPLRVLDVDDRFTLELRHGPGRPVLFTLEVDAASHETLNARMVSALQKLKRQDWHYVSLNIYPTILP